MYIITLWVLFHIDTDVIEWLQSAGRGYQTRMNAILRNAMLHSVS